MGKGWEGIRQHGVTLNGTDVFVALLSNIEGFWKDTGR